MFIFSSDWSPILGSEKKKKTHKLNAGDLIVWSHIQVCVCKREKDRGTDRKRKSSV